MFIMFYPQKHVLSTKSVGTKNEDIFPCQWKKTICRKMDGDAMPAGFVQEIRFSMRIVTHISKHCTFFV
jgi:hypothetical protein